MNIEPLLTLLHHGNQLKNTARSGWVQRGVPNAEDVAAHSFGVAFAALLLASEVQTETETKTETETEALDLGRLLAMALLHDLPEGLTTDIPAPAWRRIPAGVKTDVERSALAEILDGVSFAGDWQALWEELHAGKSLLAQIVHDADKLDMYLQASVYEAQTGNTRLAEFWDRPHRFHLPAAQAIYDRLQAERG